MSEPRIFEERFYPEVKRRMQNPQIRTQVLKHMESVLAEPRVSRPLDLPYPGERIYFGGADNSDRTEIHRLISAGEDELKRAAKDSPVVMQDSWKLANNPFNWACVMVLKALVETGNREPEVRLAVSFYATHHLAAVIVTFFPYGYNANAMEYAMNSLSSKFTLRRAGTMFRWMMSFAWKNHETYEALLRKGDDYSLLHYSLNLRTRLYAGMKDLARVYYASKESGAYMNKSKEYYDDGRMVERQSDSGRIGTLADVSTERFVGEPTNEKLMGLAARMNDVPRLSLSAAMDSIRRGEGELVRDSFVNILELFFEERKAGAKDIRSRSFIDFCLAVYARSNTKDGRVEKIKANLDTLLLKNSEAYARTNREATRGAFRKSIFFYLVLFLQASAPGG